MFAQKNQKAAFLAPQDPKMLGLGFGLTWALIVCPVNPRQK